MSQAPRSASGETGEALYRAHAALIDAVVASTCRRHRLSRDDADEFGAFVTLKLVEGEYTVLTKFEGRSSFRTFLTVVIQRLFLDHRNALWGKWRPSAPAKRAGTLAVQIEQLLVRDGHPFEEVCEILCSRDEGVTRAEIERLAALLPSRVRRRFESDEVLKSTEAAVPRPDSAVDDLERHRVAATLGEALSLEVADLDTQDRLILTLHFDDGLSIATIATMLKLDQKALYRRVEKLLRGLRERLQRRGIDSSALDVFTSPDVEVTSPFRATDRPEKWQHGPSKEKGAER